MSAGVADHEAIRGETPKTYYEEVVRIPGQQSPPNRCRDLTPVGFCESGHTILGRSSCGARYCEDHWRDWCEDAVVNMVARLAAYREAVDGAEKRMSHVVASPPQDRRYSAREMWETRSDGYGALEEAGIRGGAAVTHPYRTNDRGDALYETAVEEGEVDEETGRWRFLRDLADDWEELSGYVEASPHYHTLAAAEDVQGGDAPEDWVVKRIRTFDRFHYNDKEAYRDMARTAYYVLTHTAEQEGRQSVTYFGEVHPATFDPAEELTAAKWDKIQIRAEQAVKEEPEDGGPGTGSAGPEECPREACEAVVRDVMHLPEYLEDDDWTADVRAGEDGEVRLTRLRGVLMWWEGRLDSPPPSARSEKTAMRAWLFKRGDVLNSRRPRRQVSLDQAVMG